MADVRQIDWDTPDNESVKEHYEDLYFLKEDPRKGSIITARYKGASIRLQVMERQENKTSVAKVIGIVPDHDTPKPAYEGLHNGDMVLVPDAKRAFVRYTDQD